MSRNTIIVAGALANKMNHGGEAWVRLSWLKGFAKLGYEVHLVEQISKSQCLDTSGMPVEFRDSAAANYFQNTIADAGFSNRATLICSDDLQTFGLPMDQLRDQIAESELLVNISGHLALPNLFNAARRKAFVDIDPGFTQFWYADQIGSNLAGHDVYFTIGENIGSPGCDIPTPTPNGKGWISTRQPVALEDWPMQNHGSSHLRFTTIASWRGPFGTIQRNGKTYGLKCHEFRKFISLPANSPHQFEIALNIHPADVKDQQALLANGWHLTDPIIAGASPAKFRKYILNSDAEFSVAQGIYVESNSGWFSDRSIRYLAAGKPVVVQHTGFADHLPTGIGLIGFSTMGQAREAVESVAANYEAHSIAARKIAEEYFDSDIVLRRFLQRAL